MRRILIVGAGGHGRSVAEVVLLAGSFQIAGFLDDDYGVKTRVWEYPVFGPVDELGQYTGVADAVVVAVGNNRVRERVFCMVKETGLDMPVVVHPAAFVSPRAVVGEGSCVMAGAVVGTEAALGCGCVVNVNASVDHHCRLDDFAHLGVGVQLSGGVHVGRSAWMQAGSSAGYGVTVADEAVVLPGVWVV